jgi:hypothetical protein
LQQYQGCSPRGCCLSNSTHTNKTALGCPTARFFAFIRGQSAGKKELKMSTKLFFVVLLVVVLSTFVQPALAQGGGQMVCRAMGGCDYSDVNGYIQHVGYGQTVWYYRSLGQGFVYEQSQTSVTTGWGSQNYSGQPGDLLGLRCGLFNQGCR